MNADRAFLVELQAPVPERICALMGHPQSGNSSTFHQRPTLFMGVNGTLFGWKSQRSFSKLLMSDPRHR